MAAIQKVVTDAVDEGWGKFDVAHTMADTPLAPIGSMRMESKRRERKKIEKFVTRIFAAPGGDATPKTASLALSVDQVHSSGHSVSSHAARHHRSAQGRRDA